MYDAFLNQQVVIILLCGKNTPGIAKNIRNYGTPCYTIDNSYNIILAEYTLKQFKLNSLIFCRKISVYLFS